MSANLVMQPPQPKGYLVILEQYLTTVDGLKNVIAKPICYAEKAFALLGKAIGQASQYVARDALGTRSIIFSLDIIHKLKWFKKISYQDLTDPVRRRERAAEITDFMTSACDLVSHAANSKFIELSKKAVSRCSVVFNLALMGFTILKLREAPKDLKDLQHVPVEGTELVRTATDADRTAIRISTLINYGFLLGAVFGLPELIGMVAEAGKAALFLEWLGLGSFVFATGCTVAHYFYTQRNTVPLDEQHLALRLKETLQSSSDIRKKVE